MVDATETDNFLRGRRLGITLAIVFVSASLALARACAPRPWQIPGVPTADLVRLPDGRFARRVLIETDFDAGESARLLESLPLVPPLRRGLYSFNPSGFDSEMTMVDGTSTRWRHRAEVPTNGTSTLIISQYVIYMAQGVDFHTGIRMPFDVENPESFVLRPWLNATLNHLRLRNIRFLARCAPDSFNDGFERSGGTLRPEFEALPAATSKTVDCS